jgi:glycosyltransferase involved in cell wall biosynthesis
VRLLFVSLYFHPALRYGGPIASTWHLCRGLAAQGVGVRVVTTDADGPRRLAVPAGFHQIAPDVEARYCRRAGAELFAPGMLPVAALEIRRADAVYVSGLFVWPLPALAALSALAGKRLVIAPRGMLLPQALAGKAAKKRLFLRTLSAAGGRKALFHATSPDEEDSVRREVPGARVALVPNGVELPEGVERAEDAPPYLLFLGRVHPHKRIETILEAFALWRRGARHELWIAGDGEADYRQALARRAGELGIDHRVRFLPQTASAEKSRLLADAQALVLASRSESFGMVVAEALAHRTPCVVTATAPWEGLETERCGVWVRQEGPQALADGIARLLGHPAAERRAMGERGRAWMQRDFSWQTMARKMTVLLGEDQETAIANEERVAASPSPREGGKGIEGMRGRSDGRR